MSKYNLYLKSFKQRNQSTCVYMSELVVEGGCPTCQASTPYNPEDVVIACKYCGTIYTIGRQKIGDHKFYPPALTLKAAEDKIYGFIRKKMRFRGFSSYGGLTITKVLVPYWVVHSTANTHYRGYKRTTRTEQESYTDSQGNRRTRSKSVTVYEPVNGSINENRLDPLICRMGALLFGIKNLNKIVERKIKTVELQEFNQEQLLDDPETIKFLSGEIKSQEAKELMETKIQDEHRARAHAATTELFDCRTAVKVEGMLFLHFPIFQAEYKFGKETYRVLMDGTNGEILDAEIPITTRFRLMSFVIASLLVLTDILLAFIFQDSIETSSNTQGGFVFFSLLAFGIAFKANATAWSIESRGN